MSSNLRTKLAGIIFFGLSGAGITAPALAVPLIHYPDQVAHPDIRSWTDHDGHHQHRSNHQLFDWGTGEGQYDAYAVWTNENFNYPEPKDTTSHGSHGFIEENFLPAPDFFFAGDWTIGDGAKAQSLVRDAFKTWSDITSDKPNLITGILFNEFNDESVAEIKVHWATEAEFPDLATSIAFFDPNPQGSGSNTFYNLVFKRDHDWFFDGTKAQFLAGNKEDDFFTVALHETGHVVGLDHQTDLDDIMETLAGSRDSVQAGGAFRALSVDDTNGARDLYSIPVPEPTSTISLLALGTLGAASTLKRQLKPSKSTEKETTKVG